MGTSIVPADAGAYQRFVAWFISLLQRTPTVAKTDEESQNDELTPRRIAQATADLLWAHRNAIKVNVDPGYSSETYWFLTIPGGIRIRMRGVDKVVTIFAPDGVEVTADDSGARRLRHIWACITVGHMLEAMGYPNPEYLVSDTPDPAPGNTLATLISDLIGSGTVSLKDWAKGYGWINLPGRIELKHVYVDKKKLYWVTLEGRGQIYLTPEQIQPGLDQRLQASFSAALGLAHEQPIYMPVPIGNGRLAAMMKICREAIAMEPGLVNAEGTEIAPLVNRHLPELMKRHARAIAIAPVSEMAAIDAELEQGIEAIRLDVADALLLASNARRDELRTQLSFLSARHPVRDANLVPIA